MLTHSIVLWLSQATFDLDLGQRGPPTNLRHGKGQMDTEYLSRYVWVHSCRVIACIPCGHIACASPDFKHVPLIQHHSPSQIVPSPARGSRRTSSDYSAVQDLSNPPRPQLLAQCCAPAHQHRFPSILRIRIPIVRSPRSMYEGDRETGDV